MKSKTERFMVRATRADREAWQKNADELGLSLSSYVNMATNTYAHRAQKVPVK